MELHCICIGSEILIGHTVNTNLAFLGQCLYEAGHSVTREVCIPDTQQSIAHAVSEACAAADVVVTVGGLGPTSDDISRTVVAQTLGRPLEFRPEVATWIREFLGERLVRVPDAAIRRQSMVPRGGEALPNPNGTAPGIWCDTGEAVLVMLPGPPRELRPLFRDTVLPRLRERWPPALSCVTLHTVGVPESVLAGQVETVVAPFPEVTPAYCARPHMVDIRLTAPAAARAELNRAQAAVRSSLGQTVLPSGRSLAEAVGECCRQRGLQLATAESCTGGAVAAAITAIPGASDYFTGSIVAYDNSWKNLHLGVRENTLQQYGAVSQETAQEMLDGLRERCGATAGIAVTGIAGPGGGSAEKPVGLVYLGILFPGGSEVLRLALPGDREAVQRRTVILALDHLRRRLLAHEGGCDTSGGASRSNPNTPRTRPSHPPPQEHTAGAD